MGKLSTNNVPVEWCVIKRLDNPAPRRFNGLNRFPLNPKIPMAKKTRIPCESPFPSAKQDITHVFYDDSTPQSSSPSYRLAYDDQDFLMRDELRPIRLQLELLKPELAQREHNIQSTVVIFGSARIPDKVTAEKTLRDLQSQLIDDIDNTGIKQQVAVARRMFEKSHY
jgi:hypothetical protein